MLLQRYINPVFTDRSQWSSHTSLNDIIRQFDQVFNQTDAVVKSLPLDITEADSQYRVVAYVPLVDPQSIELNIRDRQLHIKANRPEAEAAEGHQRLLSELPTGQLERWIQFEKDISAEASATLKDGILTLTIPKKQVQQSIPIKVESA
jgi:HSP20 family protein